jgi:hypothetical protein
MQALFKLFLLGQTLMLYKYNISYLILAAWKNKKLSNLLVLKPSWRLSLV